MYLFLCRDYFFVVVANDRLSIFPPWLVEGGLTTKALAGLRTLGRGVLMVGLESQPRWLLDHYELDIGLF